MSTKCSFRIWTFNVFARESGLTACHFVSWSKYATSLQAYVDKVMCTGPSRCRSHAIRIPYGIFWDFNSVEKKMNNTYMILYVYEQFTLSSSRPSGC